MAELILQSVSKVYRKQTVLDDVSVAFPIGVHLLTGPSGAGKSTLLRLCATAEKPTRGALIWDGKNLSSGRKKLRRVLGYAPQAVDLPLDLTAMEFLRHMAALKGLAGAGAQIRDLLSRLGLGDDADKKIAAYSGGMRRRLILVQAFLGNPKLLVLDEPTAELDEGTASHVAHLVGDHADQSVILLTTHLRAHFQNVPLTAYSVADGTVQRVPV